MTNDFYTNSILPYSAIIMKLCRAYTNTQDDFEDYYQEVCLQIWRSRENFRGDSDWSTWVYRVSLNVCLTLLKKQKKNSQLIAPNNPSPNDIADASASKDDSLCELYEAIRQLSEVDRAIIVLYLDDHSYQSIAHIIGTNSNNVGVRITRIKQKLRKIMDGKVD